MSLVLIGVNHKTAPIEVRERIAISRDDLPETTRALAAVPGVAECMIVSTCNRVEILAAVEPDAAGLADQGWWIEPVVGSDILTLPFLAHNQRHTGLGKSHGAWIGELGLQALRPATQEQNRQQERSAGESFPVHKDHHLIL